ncbi:MAG: hypothetical protein L0Z70_15830 [Chloroflexi bacterium]|nr:hypothetical protein [Chloroflexota bacterium]
MHALDFLVPARHVGGADVDAPCDVADGEACQADFVTLEAGSNQFLLGDGGNPPTAVTMRTFDARSRAAGPSWAWLALAGALLAAC